MNNYYPISQPELDLNDKRNLIDAIDSGWISSKGIYIKKFEAMFKKLYGYGYPMMVTNGTAALEITLRTLNVKKNDEVILPAFGFAAAINAVISVGAKPILCDVSLSDWCMDVKELKKKINQKTHSVILIHNFGINGFKKEISKICRIYKSYLIEDCAEALGGRTNNKMIGRNSDAATFSLFANKIITCGEGGVILFRNNQHFQRAQMIINQGRKLNDKSFIHNIVGNNYRITNLQASIAFSQLKKINKFSSKRIKINKWYRKNLSKNKNIIFMPEQEKYENPNWLFTIYIPKLNFTKRQKIIKQMMKNKIELRPGFYPLIKQKPYSKYGLNFENYQNSIELGLKTISLPTYTKMNVYDVEKISQIFLRTLAINKL